MTASVNWAQPFFLTGRLQFITTAQLISGSSPTQEYLSARLVYDIPLGKFRLNFDNSNVLRKVRSNSTFYSEVNISIRRYF
jgi:hypothetical protein